MASHMMWKLALICLLACGGLSSVSAQTITYVHTDVLGSPVLETNAAGTVVRQVDYRAYGEELMDGSNPSPGQDRPGFTGHYRDGGTPFVYMQQRYYDPHTGLFLSVDSISAYAQPLGNFHRYRYANSSPYKFVDPDGRVAVVTVQRDGNYNIQFPTKFTGPAATPDNVAEAKRHVAAMSGNYTVNGRSAFVNVEVTEIDTRIFAGTPRRARNEVKLVDGPTSRLSGMSFAVTGGKYAEIDVNDRFVENGTVPHEYSHLGGLSDLYDLETRLPNPEHGDNIMNQVPGKVDSRTIEGIINSDSNIRIVE